MTAPGVLVVDDEQLIRWSIQRHLERSGYNVEVAENGHQALDQFCDDVRVVLLDLKLPDTDGLEVLKEMKSRCPFCQVILMTAYGSPESESEAQHHGVYEILNKPFDLDEMTRTIERALEAHEAPPAT